GREALARSLAPPGAPFAARVVGGRTLLRHPVSRSTTPSIEQGMADIDQGAGSEKPQTPTCKVLASFRHPVASPGNADPRVNRQGPPSDKWQICVCAFARALDAP